MSRTITEIARILHDKVAWGLSTVDEKGNVIKQYSVDKNTRQITIPQADLTNTSGNDNGNNGNNSDDTVNGTVPDSGVNTDPGKYLIKTEALWQGTADIGKTTEITLSKELSTIGDGLRFLVNIIATPTKAGVKGEQYTLEPVADLENRAQQGKYVCNVPVPISILSKNLEVGKTINVSLDGIGEGLVTTKVTQAPSITIAIKDQTKLEITNNQGYALDKTGTGNTGAFYDIQLFLVTPFTKATKVTQIPSDFVFLDALVTEKTDIALGRVNDYFTNIGDGLIVEFGDLFYSSKNAVSFKVGEFNIPQKLMIPRENLIPGYKISIFSTFKSSKEHIGFINTPGATDPQSINELFNDSAPGKTPSIGELVINQNSLTYTPCTLVGTYYVPSVNYLYSSYFPLEIKKISSYTA